MTSKEKAQQLFDKMERPLNHDYYMDFNNYAKQCALIAVDEILDVLNGEDFSRNAILFWSSVKQEIENI